MYDYAQEIRDRVDISAVAEKYGLAFNRGGFCRCPFHAEKTASFKIQNEGYAHCFGCGKNADAILLTMELLGLDRAGAVRRLNEDFSLGLAVGRKSTLRERSDSLEVSRRRRQARMLEEQRREKASAKYWALMEEWILYDKAILDFAPALPGDPIDDRYAHARKRVDYISYLLDELPSVTEQKRG